MHPRIASFFITYLACKIASDVSRSCKILLKIDDVLRFQKSSFLPSITNDCYSTMKGFFFMYRPHTLNSSSYSKSFQSTVSGELVAPYSKQFVYSKSSQYRRMKIEWKSNVYLARSRIQVRSALSKRLQVYYTCAPLDLFNLHPPCAGCTKCRPSVTVSHVDRAWDCTQHGISKSTPW